ncbi:MAG: multifunctional CCA addition/repair protein [Pseudomonadota bacterium]|nr:multifunctional CCA addition/repair protein [Pseudomonadota bacterium]
MSDPARQLECYLVGGAVRDALLGQPVTDRDWVVVGSTADEMIALGFRPVGRDFPVFLHPSTHDEYALARTERKTAPGYRGFAVHAKPTVTLEEDLRRRDLTINAIARDPSGHFVDPFGGEKDLRQRQLRHVSPAFREDPVRILRTARFAARFADPRFEIAPETRDLMRLMVHCGEVDALVPERVWQELERSLTETRPSRFFEVLRECDALAKLLPEVNNLFGVPQPVRYHPEIDSGLHTLMALDAAAGDSGDPRVAFAALLHDLGKALTPPEWWPRHRGHERRGVRPVNELCDRLRAPNQFRSLALKVCEYHLNMHNLPDLKPRTVVTLLEKLDAFRKPEMLELFAQACAADLHGRTGHENDPYPQQKLLMALYETAAATDVSDLVATTRDGNQIRETLRARRVKRVKALRRNRPELFEISFS